MNNLLERSKISTPPVEEDDPRIGHLLSKKIDEESVPDAVIIGFPSDAGVQRNGGRPGAAGGPAAIREELYEMTPDAEETASHIELIEHTADVGDINISGEVDVDQRNLGTVLAGYLEAGTVPIILGGGHETAFGHFCGYSEAGLETAILNMDAHTDVRPLKNGSPHSGSPFRQALQHSSGLCQSYSVAGLQPHSVANSHLEFIKNHGGHYHFRDETNITAISSLFHMHESEHLMVTFDMDAVDQAFAPGVSAPCVNGLAPDLWLMAAYLAGRNKQVTSFDLSEVNPNFDRDSQTVKLAALTIWHFLLGLSQRK